MHYPMAAGTNMSSHPDIDTLHIQCLATTLITIIYKCTIWYLINIDNLLKMSLNKSDVKI